MEYRFYNKPKIDNVISVITEFFEGNGFEVTIKMENPSLFVVYSRSLADKELPKIVIKVYSSEEYLSVNFLNSQKLRSNEILSSVFNLFGGGIFFLKSSKIREKIDRLEEAFWKFLESGVGLSSLS